MGSHYKAGRRRHATRDTPSMGMREEHGMVKLVPRSVGVFQCLRGMNVGWNCGSGAAHGMVAGFSRGQVLMVRMSGHRFFLLLLAVCAVQLLGTAYPNDCLCQWSPGPLQAHDQLPGTPDGQTESDQGESELEELALAQGEAFRIIHLSRTCVLHSSSCPRTAFAYDWFRPPTFS